MPPRTLQAAQRKARAMAQGLARAQRKVARLKALHDLKRDPAYRELADRMKHLKHELHQGRLNVPRHAKRIATLEKLLRKKREQHAAAEKALTANEKAFAEVVVHMDALTRERVESAV